MMKTTAFIFLASWFPLSLRAFQTHPAIAARHHSRVLETQLAAARRDFVVSTLAGACSLVLGTTPTATAAASEYGSVVDYQAVARDIMDLVKKDPNKGPTLVRLAWHSSGTYDKMR